MSDSLHLGVAGAPLVARLQAATDATLRGWSQHWGVEAACTTAPATDSATADSTEESWLVEHGAQPAVRLAWPGRLHDALGRALYRLASAPAAGTLAAQSVRHVADDLLQRLAEAWFVERWIATADAPAAADAVPRRWLGLADVQLDVAGTSLSALVPVLRFRAGAAAARPLTPAATVAAFAGVQACVEAVVGRAELSLGDVAQLQVGDVLQLDARLLDPIALGIAGGTAALPVALGMRDGARAVQLLPRSR
ncbi:MAG: FliM/FliN family flagellar motor switch protein [Burkholderiales bacterium]|nr:FliM/FliN family flagellar motor switch protein [Burkholderiales bacterium]